MQTGVISRISIATDGTQANGAVSVGSTSISADGQVAAFASNASNLVAGDTNNAADLFTVTNPFFAPPPVVGVTLSDEGQPESADVFIGTAGNDTILSFGGNDTIDAGAGDDVLILRGGNSFASGGYGNDLFVFNAPGLPSQFGVSGIMLGGPGNDIYVYNRGSGGRIRIVDTATAGAGNVLRFGQGIGSGGVRLGLGSLLIDMIDDGAEIHLSDFDPDNVLGPHAIDRFEFADSTILTYEELVARGFDIDGTDTADDLRGTNVTDRLRGFAGNDLLAGGAGNDTYLFNLGDGQDHITDTAGDDTLRLGAGITRAALSVSRVDDDMVLQFNATDRATIAGWFDGERIEHVEFADLTALTADQIEAMLTPVNTAPSVASPLADQTTAEDSAFAFQVPATTFTDPDAGDTLTYSATLASGSALPSWLTFDPATRTFTGTPANGDVGSVEVRVTATDTGGLSASDVFALAVQNVNDAPVVATAIADQAAVEDNAFSFTVPADTFADADVGDSLTYSASLADGAALPTWLTFDSATRSFTGTPTNADVGSLAVRVSATDASSASVADVFTLQVANVNDAPTLANALVDQAAAEDAPFNFTVPADTFNDVDALHGDTLTLAVSRADGSALPAWLTFEAATRTFTGTPDNDDVGSIDVLITATDTSGASVADSFAVTVANVNDAPVVANPIPDRAVNEYDAFAYTVPATTFADVDTIHGDTLTYRATRADGSALPSWLAFDPTTRRFTGMPAFSDRGPLAIKVEASDTAGARVTDTFTLTVRAVGNAIVGTNGAEVLTGTSANDVIVGRGGSDILVGNGGNDVLDAGAADDILQGGNGNDRLLGGAGNDILAAGNGNDRLEGGAGNDILAGDAGSDILHGGAGNDVLQGGPGSDTYLFNRGDGQDQLSVAGNPADQETAQIGANPLDMVFTRNGADLVMSLHGTTDRLTVNGWYNGANHRTDVIEAQDGRTLLDTQVAQLIQAMATFSANNGGITWDQAIDTRPDDVQAIISAHWQAGG